jgi:hypothetical protein
MGLFDHLFKPKPEAAGEKSGEAAATQPDDARRGESEGSQADPSTFLHPKGYGAGAAEDPVAPVHPAGARPAEKKPGPASSQDEPAGEVVLTLGDILPRIPTHFLSTGMHDLRRELRFDISALSPDIARGRASMPLSTIAALCPEIFHSPIGTLEDVDIRLPLQKVVEQIGRVGADSPPSGHDSETSGAEVLEGARPGNSQILETLETPAENAGPPAVEEEDESPAGVLEGSGSAVAEAAAPEPAAEELQIHLNVAALLPGVPIELLIGPLPRVDERLRIALPFAAIERQLAVGKVEVSSDRFVSALPPELRPYFAAREGVNVPLPLEEIFQNLPNADAKTAPAAVESPAATPPAPPAPVSAEPFSTTMEPQFADTPAPGIAAPAIEVANVPTADAAPSPAPPPSSPAVAATTFVGPPAESPPTPTAAASPPPAPAPASGFLSPVQLPPVRLFAPPPPTFAIAKTAPPAAETAARASAPEAAPPAIPAPPKSEPAPPTTEAELPKAAETPAPILRATVPEPAPASAPAGSPLILHPPVRFGQPAAAPALTPEPTPPPPLSPFGQDNLQALFMTDEALDLQKISRLAAELPGVQACVIATRETAVTGGLLPEGFDVTALLGLAPRVGEAAGRLPIGALKHFTLYGERYSVSFFERSGLCLCAVHRARSFVPGVREKLVALADELAG